ncbi:MAG: fibronectin type III domain-containing protein, partial [Thermoplasmatota archaeon]
YGGNEDGFSLRLSSSGNSLTYSSFLGGSSYDRGLGIAIDSQNRAYVTGETGSNNFPTTTNAYDTSYGGSNDAFLSVLSSSGNSLINSTYLGGSGQDVGRSIFLSSSGEAHLTGETYSNNFPTTSGAVSSSRSGGSDVFVTKLDIGGTGMIYSTYIGGTNNDEGMDVFVDSLGFIYLTGETNSNDFPTTYVAFDRTHNSNDDVFFTKFYPADFSPTGLTAKAGYFYVNITWSPPTTPIVTTNPVIGYNIYRGTSQTRLNQIASIGKVEHYNDTINDFTSRTYYYFVSAILQNLGESGESNMVSATPLVTPLPFDPVAVPGDLHVNLTWTTIDQVYLDLFDIDYHVYRGLTSSSLIRVASVGEAGFYNDSDVPPRPSRFYYMVSYNVRGVGESNLTNIVQGIPNTPPGEPEDTTLEGLDMAMNVSWLPPARDGGYPLEGYSLYKGLAPGSISHHTDLDASTTTYIDRDIVPGTTYFYAVSSSNRLGGSGLTEPIEGMGQTVPSPPKDLNALPLDQRISLEWKAPEFDWGVSVLGYKIYRGTDPDQLVHHKDLGGGVRSFTDTVSNGVTYMYSITAYNIHGESGQAGPLEAMATGIPGVVTNVTFGIGDSWVRLDWSPPVSDGGLPITVYKVYRGLQIDQLDTEFVLSSGARSFKDTDVENGVTYYYKVSASNRKGESALSAAVIATPGRVASRITQLTVAGGLESATISWTEPTDLGGREGLNIKIYRGASISSLAPLDQVPFTTRTYTDQGLSAGKVYYYAMTVINPLGEGARSPAVSAMVFGRPSAPLISGVDASSHMLNITWEPPEENGGVPLTGYRVEIRQEGDLEWEGFIETDLYHEFFGLTSGVTYDLRVKAVNTLSDGEPTEIVKVLVGDPPEEPRDVRVEPLKPEIRVKWSPRPQIALPVLGYNVYMAIGEGEPFLFRTVDSDVFEIIIEDIIQGEEYSFAVSSFNIIGEGKATAFKSVISTSGPTPVPLIWISDIGDTRVEISWIPPVFNGGAEVTGYTLFKGTTPEAPNQLATAVQGLRFIDEDVINGRIYYYRVRAENGESSEKSYPVEARPAGKPGAPQIFEGDARTDHVVLTWIPPSKDGGDVVTGYLLYRGGSLDDLTVIAHLTGNDSEYIDREVSGGRYLYRLQAENDNGIGVPVDIYVDIPSRALYAVMAGAIGLTLPLIIILLVLFLPGYLQKRREIKERKKKEAEEEELRIRRMRAEEMAARGLPGRIAGGIGLGGRAQHPSMAPPPPIHDLPPVQEPAGEEKGYIRPKEMKKERRDKKKVLRADGKSLEHREKEEDLRHSLRSRDDHKGKHWEEERKKALEEESRKVFTGQQFEEPPAAPAPRGEEMPEEPEDDGIVPTVEDVMKEMPSMSGGALEFDEDIPTWGEEEGEPVEDIPMAKIPEVRPGSAEDIEEYEELDELEELEELDELDDYEE